jgi:Raf kinase inhibitor-like YbhB/YbcL family protein
MKIRIPKHLANIVVFSSLIVTALAGSFTLNSTDITEGKSLTKHQLFNGFGSAGDNKSPQLSWKGAPEGTKSFVITMYDPDAPTGSGWWHWVAINIPATTTSLPTNASASKSLPEGTLEIPNDFGFSHYGGACPPAGAVHRYEITVFALDVDKLSLDETASPALVGFMTRQHAIGSAKITAVYTKEK